MVSCSNSVDPPTLGAFLNNQRDKPDASLEGEQPKSVVRSAEPEQMTTRLHCKLSWGREDLKEKGKRIVNRKGRFYRTVATMIGASSLIAFF